MKYLLDTNVVSELVSKRPDENVVQWLDGLDAGSVYLSAVTIGELRKGIEKLPTSIRRDQLQQWLTEDLLVRFRERILNLDVRVMLTWGELVGRLEQRGRQLNAIDSLIAAVVLANSCVLVTRNIADFQETGITLINPWVQN